MKSEPTPMLSAPKLAALLKRHAPARPPEPASDPVAAIVHSFLLWEASNAHAANAMERIARQCVDFNELRVCLPEEIMTILPSRYPVLDERASRLRRSLNDLYRREHKLSLAHVAAMGKREQRTYIENLDGMLPFVSNRVLLLHFGQALVPCDDQLVDLLTAAKVLAGVAPAGDVGAALTKAAGSAEEALRMHHALTAFADRAWHENPKGVQKAKQARIAAIEAARREARKAAEARARAEARAIAEVEAKAKRALVAKAKAEEKVKLAAAKAKAKAAALEKAKAAALAKALAKAKAKAAAAARAKSKGKSKSAAKPSKPSAAARSAARRPAPKAHSRKSATSRKGAR